MLLRTPHADDSFPVPTETSPAETCNGARDRHRDVTVSSTDDGLGGGE
jgi:hypothetical protein